MIRDRQAAISSPATPISEFASVRLQMGAERQSDRAQSDARGEYFWGATTACSTACLIAGPYRLVPAGRLSIHAAMERRLRYAR